MTETSFFSFDQRDQFLSSLFAKFQKEWTELPRFRSPGGTLPCLNGGPKDRSVHEVFMEICMILLCIGDVVAYIVADDDGFVNPSFSEPSFLEGFIVCMEIAHRSCLRYLASRGIFEQPGINGGGSCKFQVLSVGTEYVKGFSTTGRLYDVPCCTDRCGRLGMLSSFGQLDVFLEVSKEMVSRARMSAESRSDFIGIGYELSGVRLLRQPYSLEDGSTSSNLFFMSLVKRSTESVEVPDKQLYCELERYSGTRSVYDEYLAS
jgi:hypothetical protein